jgi:hypothetical protein
MIRGLLDNLKILNGKVQRAQSERKEDILGRSQKESKPAARNGY